MDLLLTSFDLFNKNLEETSSDNIFYKMPPVSISSFKDRFIPDYEVLLLANRFILDQQAFERLGNNKSGLYSEVFTTFKILKSEGFVKTVDFESILSENKDQLDQMLETDLLSIDQWIPILDKSRSKWAKFNKLIQGKINDNQNANTKSHHIKIIKTSTQVEHFLLDVEKTNYFPNSDFKGNSKYFKKIKNNVLDFFKNHYENIRCKNREDRLVGYLKYVNSNILISKILNSGFYDWQDLEPFYSKKFNLMTEEEDKIDITQNMNQAVKNLFEVSFPDFKNWNVASLVSALKDKRIIKLRKLVQDAANGEVEFDLEFAQRTFDDIKEIKKDVEKKKKMIFRSTIPLKLIPHVGALASDLIRDFGPEFYEKRKKEKYQWFYFIREYGSKD